MQIRAKDVGPPLKKRHLCEELKRKAKPTPAKEPALKRRRVLSPLVGPTSEKRTSTKEINADKPGDRRRSEELVSPLPTIPEEEEEIEGTDEEVQSKDAVVAPATTAPSTEESTMELVNVREEQIQEQETEDVSPPATEELTMESVNVREEREEQKVQEQPEDASAPPPATEESTMELVDMQEEEEVQEQPEDASVPATREESTMESTNEGEVPTEESAASAASTTSTNVSEEEGQPEGTTDETQTDPEVAQDVSAFTTFRYGSGFISCKTKHGRKAVRCPSLHVQTSHKRSRPTERAPSRLDITIDAIDNAPDAQAILRVDKGLPCTIASLGKAIVDTDNELVLPLILQCQCYGSQHRVGSAKRVPSGEKPVFGIIVCLDLTQFVADPVKETMLKHSVIKLNPA